MIWIIPMSGDGTRTKTLGEFKPFIKIKGHKLFSWFISSIKHLVKENDKFVLITTEYFSEKFSFKSECKKVLLQHGLHNKIYFIVNKRKPLGASETVYSAKKIINVNEPIIVIFPDQYIDFILPEIENNTAYLGVYVQLSDKSGFVEIKDGKIIRFVEKRNISNIASAGFYLVSSGKLFINALEEQFKHKETLNNEYYVGPAFNYLFREIDAYPIPVISKYDLGNVADIEYFCSKNISCL